MHAKPEKPADIDAYLARLGEADRAALQRIRETAHSIAPESIESISYDVPTLKYRGRPLIYFGAFKKHLAVYGMDIAAHASVLAAFETEKGTVRFTAARPLPDALVRSLVAKRKAEIDAKATLQPSRARK